MPPPTDRSCVRRNGSWTGGDGLWVELSGKMSVLAKLLSHIRRTTDDRIVLVSNFTQASKGHGLGKLSLLTESCSTTFLQHCAPREPQTQQERFAGAFLVDYYHSHISPTRSILLAQTLDLFTQLCRERGYPAIRLDGGTNMSKRQKFVLRFNDPREVREAMGTSSLHWERVYTLSITFIQGYLFTPN